MPQSAPSLETILALIDAANAQDPNRHDDRPLAQLQGERATHWVTQLTSTGAAAASDAVVVAARGHHLRRWEFPRSDFPAGRPGYLRWRREAKQRHAGLIGDIVTDAGWPQDQRAEVERLTKRQGLGTDASTQLVEDAACLVFLETQFEDMVSRTETEKMIDVVARTLKKMSPEAIALTAQIPLSTEAQNIVERASTR